MEQQSSGEAQSQDDWLAGAQVAAHAQDIYVGSIEVSLDGLEPPDPNVA